MYRTVSSPRYKNKLLIYFTSIHPKVQNLTIPEKTALFNKFPEIRLFKKSSYTKCRHIHYGFCNKARCRGKACLQRAVQNSSCQCISNHKPYSREEESQRRAPGKEWRIYRSAAAHHVLDNQCRNNPYRISSDKVRQSGSQRRSQGSVFLPP